MLRRVRQTLIRNLCGSRLFDVGVRAVSALPDRRKNLLRVLTYHRVADENDRPDLDPSLISATPDRFAEQIRWLSRDFDLVGLNDLFEAIQGSRPLPPRAVLITFDDAYGDFCEHAWPVLKTHEAPVALFVPTGFPDQPTRAFWWDRLHCSLTQSDAKGSMETPWGPMPVASSLDRQVALRALKQKLKSLPQNELQATVSNICEQLGGSHPMPTVLSWIQLRQLASEGVTLVPHSQSHPHLNRVPLSVARDEICGSRDELHRQTGILPRAFAYPAGLFDPDVVGVIRQAGFLAAFTTLRGINDLRSADPLRLRRANVARHTPDALIRMQLLAPARFLNGRLPDAYPDGPRNPSRHPGSIETATPASPPSPVVMPRPTDSGSEFPAFADRAMSARP